jgi:hypothetical protein
MEYGKALCLSNIDNGFKQHVGWSETIKDHPNYCELWGSKKLLQIQQKITQLLEGLRSDGRQIIVPVSTIGNVMSQVYETHRPQVGDIYSRYIQEDVESERNDNRDIVDRTIEIVVTQIRNEYEIAQNNNKLTIWSTLYGDFNKQGLRAHPPIKIRKRRSDRMMFHMNY